MMNVCVDMSRIVDISAAAATAAANQVSEAIAGDVCWSHVPCTGTRVETLGLLELQK